MSNKAGLYQGKQDSEMEATANEESIVDNSFSAYLLIKAEDFTFEQDDRDTFKANIEIEIGLSSRDLLDYFMKEYDARKNAAPSDIASDR